MANITFVLHEPYKKGVYDEVKERLRNNKNVDSLLNPGQTPVYIIVRFDRTHRFKMRTDLKAFPRQWDFAKQKFKSQASNSQSNNKRLRQLTEKVDGLINEIYDRGNPTFDYIKQSLRSLIKSDKKPIFNEENISLDELFNEQIISKRGQIAYRTIQKLKTTQSLVDTFIKDVLKKERLAANEVDLVFYDKFKSWLLNDVMNPRTKEKGYLDDTVAKHISMLKTTLKWGWGRGLHTNTIHVNSAFKASRKSKHEIVTLTPQELKQLYQYDFEGNLRLQNARDLFCFAAFTGQRWSDVEEFNKEHIVGDEWQFFAQKTGKRTIVPFVGYIAPALEILKRHNFVLPKISNQKFNVAIKDAAEIAKLNRVVPILRTQGNKKIISEKPLHKHISAHTARRTCVSILLNYENMPISQVRDITNHENLRTLDKYINKDHESTKANLRNTRSVIAPMRVIKSASS